jgi:type IV pilus assembly protein PilY1
MIPSTDPCSYGGGSWLMDINALSGSRLAYTPFDLDGNSQFNELDYVTVTVAGAEVRVPASGIYNDALMSRPAFVSGPDSEIAYTTDTGGDVNTTRVNPGPAGVGRQSWRQLR